MDLKKNAFDFVPPQFHYPKERDQLVEYMKTQKDACYIAKRQSGGQGTGIEVFRELKELEIKLASVGSKKFWVI